MSKPNSTPRPWAILRPILRLSRHLLVARTVILAVHLVFIGGGYLAVLRLAEFRAVSVWDSHTWMDDWLSPVPWAFWVYATLYLYFPVTLVLSPRTRSGLRALLLHLQAQIILSVATWCVFLICPTEIHIRQQMELAVQESSPVLREVYEGLYRLDRPWNAWPSLHVSLSLLMLFACAHFTTQSGTRHGFWARGPMDRWMVLAGTAGWIALCWSILATKQHFFFDVWTGALAGLCTWTLYLRPRLRRLQQRV